MSDAQSTVVKAIKGLLKRRKADEVDLSLDSDLYGELELDSLEVAELSAELEDELGRDPYSEGQTPRTVGEVVKYYEE